jgi:hypothetical protein
MSLERQRVIDGTPVKQEIGALEPVAHDDARGTRCNGRIIVPRSCGSDVMTVVEEPLAEPESGE